jgi:hypothetical protein
MLVNVDMNHQNGLENVLLVEAGILFMKKNYKQQHQMETK